MSCSGSRARLLVPLLLLCACSPHRPAGVRKIAIPPFENLSADPGLEWMEAGFAELLRIQLTGSPRSLPVRVRRSGDALAAGAGYILHGYFSRAAGRLRVEAALEDLRTHSTVATASASAPGDGGVIALGEAIARQIDSSARAGGTQNVAALRSLAAGISEHRPEAADNAFKQALASDPDFGAAYVAWTQSLIARRDLTAARELVRSARARAGRFQPAERDTLALAAASLDNDAAARRAALAALTNSTPADPGPFVALAELDFNARAFPGAVLRYSQALERDPDNVAILNQLGYAQAYAGDLGSAVETLSRYRDLRPREANPLDSLGDVHYYHGRLVEAEQYYLEAHGRDASFQRGGSLYKAAWARLMNGDLAGADALFARYMQARADGLAPYRQAQWHYLTGRRSAAMARMAKLNTPLAAAQLAIWQLETGDPENARRNAQRAGAAGLGAIVRFLTGPPGTPSEWEARAAAAFPSPQQAAVHEYALAYALLYSKHFGAAAQRLQALYARTPPGAAESVEVVLAWALLESGDAARAARLLVTNPIPDAAGEHPFLSLSFPRLLYLRAKKGTDAFSAGNYRLFLRYSGDLPMMFGEEARTRAALAGR